MSIWVGHYHYYTAILILHGSYEDEVVGHFLHLPFITGEGAG